MDLIDQGVALFNAGRFEEAERLFRRAERSGGDDRAHMFRLQARVERARAASRGGRAEEARRLLAEVLRADPGHAAARPALLLAYREQARAFESAGQPERACALLRRAVAALPGEAVLAQDLAAAQARWARLKAQRSGSRESLDAARAALRRAVRADPGQARLRLELGRLEQEAGDFQAALAEFSAALEADERMPGLHLALAELHWHNGDLEKAAPHLRQEIASGSRSPQAYRLWGETASRLGRRREALAALREAVALGAGEEAEIALAQLEAPGGRRGAARLLRKAAAPSQPVTGPAGDAARIAANLLLGRFDEAFAAAEGLLSRDRGQEALERLLFPLIAVPEEELRARPRLFRQLASWRRKHPGDPWGWLVSVYLLHRFARPRRVLAELERFGRPPARYEWMRFLRAKLLLHLRCDYEAAEAEFARASRSAPALMMARAYMAETLLCRGRDARAWRIMDDAVSRYGGRAGVEARAWRGAMRLWTGRYAEALADLTPTSAAGARFARAWRGGALAQLGRLSEAERELRVSLLARRDDHEALVWRGEALRRLGRLDEALPELETALALHPRSPWALANRGLLWLERGKESKARADLAAMAFHDRRLFARAAGGGAASPRAVFEAALRLARGVRRVDAYLRPLWARE